MRTLLSSWRHALWLNQHVLLGSCHDDRIQLGDLRSGKILATLQLGTWASRVALVTTQDRALIVRLQLPLAERGDSTRSGRTGR